jgi:hypothetical protein
VNAITEYLCRGNLPNLILGRDIDAGVANFYAVINRYFELYAPKFIADDPNLRNPWFDQEHCILDKIKTKAHKLMLINEREHATHMT